jgi:short-subunit dehydrogenase involved in D-alanine esterification of teichoic acids
MFEVANRRVIITGAAQGLGKEFVRRLLQVINFLIFFSQNFLSENLISSHMLTNIKLFCQQKLIDGSRTLKSRDQMVYFWLSGAMRWKFHLSVNI